MYCDDFISRIYGSVAEQGVTVAVVFHKAYTETPPRIMLIWHPENESRR